LIDLIVAAVVLVIILSYVLANFRGATRSDINLTLNKFISDIRQAQTESLAGKITGVCYEEASHETALGLCDRILSCEFCQPEYPNFGYGVATVECSNPPCNYFLFADVNGDGVVLAGDLLPSFPERLLGETTIEQVCYSDQIEEPDFPPFENFNCATGWKPGSFFGLVFQADKVSLKTRQPLVNEPDIKYIAMRIKDQNKGRQAFLYISASGLISSGILK